MIIDHRTYEIIEELNYIVSKCIKNLNFFRNIFSYLLSFQYDLLKKEEKTKYF